MFALLIEVKKSCRGLEIEKGNGDVRDYNIRAAAEVVYTTRVLVVRTPVSSLLFQVQHTGTWHLVRYMQAPNRLYKSEVRASVMRDKLLVGRDYLITRTCYEQSNAFLMRRWRRRSAVYP